MTQSSQNPEPHTCKNLRDHSERYPNPSVLVSFDKACWGWVLALDPASRDGASVQIFLCPWCGTRLEVPLKTWGPSHDDGDYLT